jgi:hypothetical protein
LSIVVSGTPQWVKVFLAWYDWLLEREFESVNESELETDSAVATQLEFAWDYNAGAHGQDSFKSSPLTGPSEGRQSSGARSIPVPPYARVDRNSLSDSHNANH